MIKISPCEGCVYHFRCCFENKIETYLTFIENQFKVINNEIFPCNFLPIKRFCSTM